MSRTQLRAGTGADKIASGWDDELDDDLEVDTTAPESFHERLVAAGFAPTAICVIGTVDNRQRRAEVYEEEACSPSHPPRFLVRLIVPGECEHVVTLDNLPEVLGHFDRLMPLFAPLLQRDTSGRNRS